MTTTKLSVASSVDVYVGDTIRISNGHEDFLARVLEVERSRSTTEVTIEEVPKPIWDNGTTIEILDSSKMSNADWVQDPPEPKHPMKRAKGDWKTT